MVLPVIICLLKPSSPICKDEPEPSLAPDLEEEDLSQDELLGYGGIGLLFTLLLGLLVWALNKILQARNCLCAVAAEANATELREIKRHLEEGRKSNI